MALSDIVIHNNSLFNRRDFLKLKFFVIFYLYFFDIFSAFFKTHKSKQRLDYSFLDKLEKLPFSKKVKQEIGFRIGLQRKYCFDSRGYLQPLDRFFKETTDFIVSSKNFDDFVLLCTIKDFHMDYLYMFDQSIKRGALAQLKFLQQKFLGVDEKMMKNALIGAFKSKSKDIIIHFLQQKIVLDRQTKDEIANIFKNEEYEILKEELLKISNLNLLSLPKKKQILTKKKRVEKAIICDLYNAFSYNEREQASVNNALVSLERQKIIDDFTLKIERQKIFVTVWNYKSIYPINFIDIFNKTLEFHGFNLNIEYFDKNVQEQILFIKKEEDRLSTQSNEPLFDSYNNIMIEIL